MHFRMCKFIFIIGLAFLTLNAAAKRFVPAGVGQCPKLVPQVGFSMKKVSCIILYFWITILRSLELKKATSGLFEPSKT